MGYHVLLFALAYLAVGQAWSPQSLYACVAFQAIGMDDLSSQSLSLLCVDSKHWISMLRSAWSLTCFSAPCKQGT